jgi:hypothetical protein
MRNSVVFSLVFIMMMPLLSGALSSPLIAPAQAADACQGDTQAIVWNQTMQRMAMVPHYANNYDPYYYEYYDDGYYEDDGEPPSSTNEDLRSLGPEEPWMYQQNSWNLPTLDPLETSHYTTMLIGNNSVGALRLNLSATQRTTICVTLQDADSNPVKGDVYLLTTAEYNSYRDSYECGQEMSWWCYEGDLEESLSDIPPEWRSWNPLGWKSYRDAHEYEQVSSVNFALNLDKAEVYTPLWGGADWQDFYLVIDAWDNIHDADADAPGVTVAADVTIITTTRSLVLPPFTVALTFMVIILAGLVAPFILNAKYMRAGLAPKDATEGLVPSLERPADLPQFGGQMPMPPMPVHPSLAPLPTPGQIPPPQHLSMPVQVPPPQQLSMPPQVLPPAGSTATPSLEQNKQAPTVVTVAEPTEKSYDDPFEV